jgi:hypothetical protein
MSTPNPSWAEAGAVAFFPYTIIIHGINIYWLIALATNATMISSDKMKLTIIIITMLTAVVLYWYYIWKGKGGEVISAYERKGNQRRYTRIGWLMFIETTCVTFLVVFFLILGKNIYFTMSGITEP